MTGRHSRLDPPPDDFEYEYEALTERGERTVTRGATGRHAALQSATARQTLVEDLRFSTEPGTPFSLLGLRLSQPATT